MRKLFRIVVILVVGGLVYAGIRFGPDALTAYRAGFFDKAEMRKYEGTSIDNLKAIRTALLLYHDSEDAFPNAKGWMDAIEPRLKTADMEASEALKKLRNPASMTQYGYAMNPAVSGKYKGDLKSPETTILVYERLDGPRNAYGDPKAIKPTAGQNLAITVSGEIVRLDAKN